MININLWLFIILCVFALIGAVVVLFIVIYFFFGILDLTYHERHKHLKDNNKDCPNKIERE